MVLNFTKRAISRLRNSAFYFPFLIWTHYYDRLDRRPGYLTLAISQLVIQRPARHYRRFVATRLPIGFEPAEDGPLPEIELLFVVASKDFHLLSSTVPAAVRNSENPISKVIFVVPDGMKDVCLRNLPVEYAKGENVIEESQLLGSSDQDKLGRAFGNRKGWILQQVLKISYVLNSQSEGVLTVDSDTALNRKRVWLTSSGTQPLLVSSEFNAPYYSFLNSLSDQYPLVPPYTFVTHHMLFQPSILKFIEDSVLGLGSGKLPTFLIDRVVDWNQEYGQTLFSVDFELYAQFLVQQKRSKVALLKFANRPVYSHSETYRQLSNQNLALLPYASLSYHSYLS